MASLFQSNIITGRLYFSVHVYFCTLWITHIAIRENISDKSSHIKYLTSYSGRIHVLCFKSIYYSEEKYPSSNYGIFCSCIITDNIFIYQWGSQISRLTQSSGPCISRRYCRMSIRLSSKSLSPSPFFLSFAAIPLFSPRPVAFYVVGVLQKQFLHSIHVPFRIATHTYR